MADDGPAGGVAQLFQAPTQEQKRKLQKAQSKLGSKLKASVDNMIEQHPLCNLVLYAQSAHTSTIIAARCHGPEFGAPSFRCKLERLMVEETAARQNKRLPKSRFTPEQEDAQLYIIQSAVDAGELGRAQAERILADAGLGLLTRFRRETLACRIALALPNASCCSEPECLLLQERRIETTGWRTSSSQPHLRRQRGAAGKRGGHSRAAWRQRGACRYQQCQSRSACLPRRQHPPPR